MTAVAGLSRRTVLGAGAGLVAGLIGGGCTSRGQMRIEVAVGWGGVELDRLRRVLRGYERKVEVTPVNDDIDAFLRSRHRAGNLPDVAVVPRPGLLRAYAQRGWLRPLDGLTSRFPDAWNEFVRVDDRLYGVWLRAAHKSLFWYRPSMFEGPFPESWDELVELVRELARADGPAPLAVGAADGWVLTDWFENLLAARADLSLYRALAEGQPRWDHPVVRAALTDLATIWGIPGAFPGGGRRALLTGFDQSVVQVAGTREALLVFEGDFVASTAAPFLDTESGGERLAYFRFPSPTVSRPLVVGGDAAVVTNGSPAGFELVEWLSGGNDVFADWRKEGDYLSPNVYVPVERYPDGAARQLARELRDPDHPVRFDLSDLLPGELNGAAGVGTWQVLQDFFARVAVRQPDVGAAVDEAVTALDDMARRVAHEAATEGPR